jgi:hypothetical protein
MTNIQNKHKQPEEMLLTVAATITEEEMRSMISNDQLGELIKTQNNRDEPDIKHHQPQPRTSATARVSAI